MVNIKKWMGSTHLKRMTKTEYIYLGNETTAKMLQ